LPHKRDSSAAKLPMKKSRKILTPDMLSEERQQKFWNRAKEMPDGCLIWQGSKNSRGYGQFSVQGQTYLAHIVAYTLRKQPIPSDNVLYHTCDSRACINPDHLQLSNTESLEWKARTRERAVAGWKERTRTPLSVMIVRDIRERYYLKNQPMQGIADATGLSIERIETILSGRSWKANGSGIELVEDKPLRKRRHAKSHQQPGGKAKQTEQQVAEIRERVIEKGERPPDLMKEYGIKSTTIYAILAGERWKTPNSRFDLVSQSPYGKTAPIKLTEQQVAEIRVRVIENGEPPASLLDDYGVKSGTIWAVLSGATWKTPGSRFDLVGRSPYGKTTRAKRGN